MPETPRRRGMRPLSRKSVFTSSKASDNEWVDAIIKTSLEREKKLGKMKMDYKSQYHAALIQIAETNETNPVFNTLFEKLVTLRTKQYRSIILAAQTHEKEQDALKARARHQADGPHIEAMYRQMYDRERLVDVLHSTARKVSTPDFIEKEIREEIRIMRQKIFSKPSSI